MADYPALVNNHLGAAYHAIHTAHEPRAVVHRRLQDTFNADPELLAAAKKRRDQLTEAVTRKDFVSRTQREILNAVIGEHH